MQNTNSFKRNHPIKKENNSPKTFYKNNGEKKRVYEVENDEKSGFLNSTLHSSFRSEVRSNET